jgi:pyrimidine deaminase RibD-like protein
MAEDFLSFLKLAKNVAKHSEYKIKVGCVITNKNKPVAIGFNKLKCPNRRYKTEYNTTHAEISALQNSGKERIKGSVMYIYREDRNGNTKLSKPCEFCLPEIIKFGVKKVYYTIEEFPYLEVMKI